MNNNSTNSVEDKIPETTKILLGSVNETARITRTALLLFLVVALYLLIIVGTTTDLMLLRGEIVALPLMEVGVPVVAFYIAAPLIFLLLHINLLLRLSQLTEAVRQWEANILYTVNTQRGVDSEVDSKELKDQRRTLVFPLDFIHLLIGGKSRWVLWPVVVIQIVLLPIIVLLVLQMSFLAYQSPLITSAHQLIVTVDLVSLLLFAFSVRGALAERKIDCNNVWAIFFQGQKKTFFGMKIDRNDVLKIFFQVSSASLVLFFTWTIAVVPNIEQEMVITETEQSLLVKMMKMNPDNFCFAVDGSQKRSIQQQLSACIFADWWRGYPLTAYRPFRRYLKVVEQPIALKEAPPEIVGALIRQKGDSSPDIPCEHIGELDLSGRQLNYARFDGSQFYCMKLEGTKLHSVNLREAKLHDADLSYAKLHGAHLSGAKLHGASLSWAELHGADLIAAELYGAKLFVAELHGAKLWGAKLHGADLSYAKLHGADLRRTELHGADLRGVELHGADLKESELHGANLSYTELHGANLKESELYGADLRKAELYGADLGNVRLNNTDLSDVYWDKPKDLSELIQRSFRLLDKPKGLFEFMQRTFRLDKSEDWDAIISHIEDGLKKRGLADDEITDKVSQITTNTATKFGFIPPTTPTSTVCVSHSGEGPFEKWPIPANGCYSEFISSIVEAACRNQWTAKGIVNRAISNKNINLINALLKKDCSVLYSYHEKLSEELK